MAGEIDLSQFHDVFYEESFENVEAMEVGLLNFNVGAPDAEAVNTVFRAAHSIKGGASTFGFATIAEFTHVVETLLDEVRTGDRMITAKLVDILLESVDQIRIMLSDSQAGREIDESQTQALSERLKQAAENPSAEEVTPRADAAVGDTRDSQTSAKPAPSIREWLISFVPLEHMLMTGNEPFRMIRELETLGELRVKSFVEKLPYFNDMNAEACYLYWELRLKGEISRDDIDEVFEWVEGDCTLDISEIHSADVQAEHSASTDATTNDQGARSGASEEGTLIAELAEEAQSINLDREDDRPAATPEDKEKNQTDAIEGPQSVGEKTINKERHPLRRAEDRVVGQESSSIRVNIDKVDNLINLVGELIITQSILNRLALEGNERDHELLLEGMQQLERNTRELQEQTMRIRMLPIDFVLQRMPRLVRDLSQSLGKQAELQLRGNQTEVDKTVLEKISDPLTHLIRNALDHGIETPEQRLKAGKPATGVIEISAYHQGGNIIIDVADDGAGLDPAKLRQKGIDSGFIAESDEHSEQELFNLIFAPGFSTAKVVSDVSGRGVGMDVVSRNIDDLNGDIKVTSTTGEGSMFRISLPLTLSILDGQLVRVGKEVFILSMLSIVKSVQIEKQNYSDMAEHSEVYRYEGDEYIPIVRLDEIYSLEKDYKEITDAILIVIDANKRYGIVVDEVLGQQQVVIKNLESNYRQVASIAGATILGDGQVAMIIDANGLIEYVQSLNSADKSPVRLAV